jgi:CBS domain-containing protein
MSVQGLPVGGLKTVGQIVATNTLTFYAGQEGLAIAVALLSTHTAGAPVVDGKGTYLGFINEFDVMKALDAGKDLDKDALPQATAARLRIQARPAPCPWRRRR